MRDALIAIALLLALVAAFSCWGPAAAEDPGGGAGLCWPGESALVVPGAGAEGVTVFRATTDREAGEETQAPAQSREELTTPAGENGEPGGAGPQEEHMDNLSNLIWYTVGVLTVLIGEFAGVVVARAWHRLRDEHKEE